MGPRGEANKEGQAPSETRDQAANQPDATVEDTQEEVAPAEVAPTASEGAQRPSNPPPVGASIDLPDNDEPGVTIEQSVPDPRPTSLSAREPRRVYDPAQLEDEGDPIGTSQVSRLDEGPQPM